MIPSVMRALVVLLPLHARPATLTHRTANARDVQP